ncbi:MAG TPA: 50S ribosomal protein L29 [bacterium]|nr:50S ribosomal protein L29 [bacterium]HOH08502.1 50S ribosomal protein L29 [bacterium]HPG83361.1 50S ribosomal protein L29 [bacterium]HPM58836.1 50S ribosomal protein L29 [bacterium]
MNKTEELRKLSLKELDMQLEDALLEMSNLRIQHSTRQLDNPLRIKRVRRDIARLKTIINEKSQVNA